MSTEFEAVIGLEVHCQLSTESKIFCGCPAKVGTGETVASIKPNSNTCPVCTAQPGALPVLNRKVVEYAIRAGLATGCAINPHSFFARKNYFYPDLPKGYQISQYQDPICSEGFLQVEIAGTPKRIRIQRIHMEEDAGKNVHAGSYSLVNLNRAGVPLLEIVTHPDMKTPEEAGAYLRALYAVVTYLGITDGNLQEGNFRCDANVSVMPRGSQTFGTRAEIKNVNSFRYVEKAIEFEIARQIALIQAGGKVVQETRTFDSAKNITTSMRAKEEAHDYRYFPDPDLIPLNVDAAWIEKVRATLPELPEEKRARYVRDLGLSPYDAAALTSSPHQARFFEASCQLVASLPTFQELAKAMANLLTGEVTRLVNENGIEIHQSHLKPEHLVTLVQMTRNSELSSTAAKQVLGIVWSSGGSVEETVAAKGLKQVNDLGALEPAIIKVIAAFPAQVAEYKSGKEKILGFLVGQVMKETGGKANPGMLQELIKKKMSS